MAEGSWQGFLDLLEKQQDARALERLFDMLLTQDERASVGDRLAIFRALIAGGESQRDVAARLGVSIAKVTRCSNNLKQFSSAEKNILQ